MLVHVSRFNDVQRQIFEKLEELKKGLGDFITEAKNIFDRRFADHKHLWEQVQKVLPKALSSISVKPVNQDGDEFSYPKDKKINVIVVGGESLSRGFTLEGLSVSYFVRDSKSYDTLMQMGRWFGYRDGYEDLCKIYMPEEIQEKFKKITDAINDLMAQLKRMNEEGGTPLDFGLAVRKVAGLRPTSRNKMRSVMLRKKIPVSFFGISRFSKNRQIHANNLEVLRVLVEFLGNHENEKMGSYMVYREVNNERILSFVEKFEGIENKQLVLKYLEGEKNNNPWIVYLNIGGEGNEVKELGIKGMHAALRRNFKVEKDYLKYGGIQRITSGKVINKIDKDVLAKNPILFLYILELTTKEGEENPLEGILVPAYEVSFPRDVQNQAQEREGRYYNAQQDNLDKEEKD